MPWSIHTKQILLLTKPTGSTEEGALEDLDSSSPLRCASDERVVTSQVKFELDIESQKMEIHLKKSWWPVANRVCKTWKATRPIPGSSRFQSPWHTVYRSTQLGSSSASPKQPAPNASVKQLQISSHNPLTRLTSSSSWRIIPIHPTPSSRRSWSSTLFTTWKFCPTSGEIFSTPPG